MMRSRRALLYMPGNEMRKIKKATTLGADSICMDLEDAVAANRKEEARATVCEALMTLDFGKSERLVRINSVHSGLAEKDLVAILPYRPDGIILPKVFSAEQMLRISWLITEKENTYNWPINSISLIVVVETAQAIINLDNICSAFVPRMEAVICGAEDLTADIGATRTREAWEVFYARSAVVMYAAAYGLQAIDMVNDDFRDIEFLEKESLQASQMGFTGKQVIHPKQVEVVQTAFTPNDEAVADARKLIQAFQERQDVGNGAFAIEGKMIDLPMIKRAENILERARAAGKIVDPPPALKNKP